MLKDPSFSLLAGETFWRMMLTFFAVIVSHFNAGVFLFHYSSFACLMFAKKQTSTFSSSSFTYKFVLEFKFYYETRGNDCLNSWNFFEDNLKKAKLLGEYKADVLFFLDGLFWTGLQSLSKIRSLSFLFFDLLDIWWE